MSYAKPLLALSSAALGAALVVLSMHVQRDRFAFTGAEPRNSDATEDATFVAPAPQPIILAPVVITGELRAVREVAPEPISTPRPKRVTAGSTPESSPSPCRASWRELGSGPAGRMVRDIC